MKSVWTDHITDKDLRQTHVSALRSSTHIKQLRDILEDKEKQLINDLISSPEEKTLSYKWKVSMLREVLSLLNFDQKETK